MEGRLVGRRKERASRLPQILLVLIGFLLIFVGKADITAARHVKSGVVEVIAPLMEAVAAPIQSIENMFEGMRTVASLREEAQRLKAQNERLRRWQRRAEILESENRQLRSVLGAVIPQDRVAVTARVITAPGSSFVQTVLIQHGEGFAVRRGDPVVTADGLVGMIVEPGNRYSRVLLLSDVNARIPVILSRSSWPGLIHGQNSLLLKLQFLPLEARPTKGELVQTSGHGGVLPAGIPVGRIEQISSEQVLVRPSVDLRQLSFVSVLLRDEEATSAELSDLDGFFTPLINPEDERLLEGFNTRDVLPVIDQQTQPSERN
ncbi:MAG: rod shape-determining protein MreC [Candidatus Puniceispirillaceae bacterium]